MAKNRVSHVSNNRNGHEERMKAISNARTFEEVSDYMKSTYDIDVERRMANYDLNTVKQVMGKIEEMIDLFPQLKDTVRAVGGWIGGNATGTFLPQGLMMLNPKEFGDLAAAESRYADGVKSGYHPEGTSFFNVIDHEMGHALELHLTQKRYSPDGKAVPSTSAARAFANGEIATEIINAAIRRTIPGFKGTKKATKAALSGISRYAATKPSEAIAEAVADYRANGNNARPLSKEIMREIRTRLR